MNIRAKLEKKKQKQNNFDQLRTDYDQTRNRIEYQINLALNISTSQEEPRHTPKTLCV